MTSRAPIAALLAVALAVTIGLAATGSAATALTAPEAHDVSLSTSDGVTIRAHLYPAGSHAVVLAHGGVFDKESWRTQAEALVEVGLTVLAFDFRGYGGGEPTYGLPGKELDVLAAIDYLAAEGYERISLVGGSMGGQFAMAASARTDRIDRLVLLAPGSGEEGAGIQARSTLIIVAEGDRLRAEADRAYAAAPEPKQLEVLPGKAHAQHIFRSEHGETVTRLMVEFLTADG